jgi:hypothetical protein
VHVTTLIDRSGQTWQISRRLFVRPRFPGLGRRPSAGDGLDAGLNFGSFDISGGLSGLAIALLLVVAVLAIVTVWPIVVFLIELVVVALAGCVHALLGRRIVVAETDREVWSWVVKGQPASVRLVARIADALHEGGELPPGGRLQTTASSEPMTEEDVAARPESQSVRVIRPDRAAVPGRDAARPEGED